MKEPKSKLALQLYTVRDFMKTPEDTIKTLKKVKKIGYDAIQTAGYGGMDVKDFKKALDDTGLYCCATHENLENLTKHTGKVIEEHNILECNFTALGHPGAIKWTLAGLTKLAKQLDTAGEKLRKANIGLGYHNHAIEFQKIGNKTALEHIYSMTKNNNLQGEIDTFWVQRGGADPVLWINKLKGRMEVIHFKDFIIKNPQQEIIFAEIGEGNLNWKSIIKSCKEIGIRWHIVEEDVCQRDPFKSIKISLENLKKLGIK